MITTKTDLQTLLRHVQPVLQDGVYVFAMTDLSLQDAAALNPVQVFREEEGTALILQKDMAEHHGIAYRYPARMITLNAYSALDAVGFLAAITRVLADAGISVNPVSAFYHDHLFVPEERADEAMALLRDFM